MLNSNTNSNDTIEWIEEYLNSTKTNEICKLVNSMSESLWCFSLRKCTISDSDYEKLIRSLKSCRSSLCYLNLSVNVINSIERANVLARVLPKLSNLHTLSLHSSNLRDEGMKLLYYSLGSNNNFKSLDIGDCELTDKSVSYIREIIHRRHHEHGLNELILSSNAKITLTGWSQILISVASASDLECLYLDFNSLDDSCGYLLSAILSSNHTLRVLDLEHTGLTNKTASLLLYLFRNYHLTIKTLNLLNNNIDYMLINELQAYVDMNDDLLGEKQTKLDQSNMEESMILNENNLYDLKPQDQLKLDQYVKNANKLDLNNQTQLSEYEKSLERDFKSLLVEQKKMKKKKQLQQQFENDGDLLQPTSEDFRYRRHTVLPFNLAL